MSYIQKRWWNMSFIVLIVGQKWSHPHGDDESEMTKRRIDNNRSITESKKCGCVCTCCHRNDLPQYNCVIFLKHNYNLNIPVVANALSNVKLSHVNHVIKNYKMANTARMSKIVQILICLGLM